MKIKRPLLKKFIVITCSFVGIFLITAGLSRFFLGGFTCTSDYDPDKQIRDLSLMEDLNEPTSENEEEKNDLDNDSSFFNVPIRTNVMIVGVDNEESLTDTIIVASIDKTDGNINLVSVPRDTYVRFRGSGIKINSVNSYSGGGEKGMRNLEEQLEEILNIKINYYVKVNLEAFRSIVDSVGGIEFTVPDGGLRYSDPTQNLYINLKEGRQLLNGKDAEGLVRFRKGYATQDLKRAEVQQEFLKEFARQVLNKETLKKNMKSIAIDFIKYVETDFSVLELPKYLPLIDKINADNMKTDLLPGEATSIDGLSFYVYDKALTRELSDEFFYGIVKEEETTEETTEFIYNSNIRRRR